MIKARGHIKYLSLRRKKAISQAKRYQKLKNADNKRLLSEFEAALRY
jgi:hypothetical protein